MAEEATDAKEPEGDAPEGERKGLRRMLLLLGVIMVAGAGGFGTALLMGGPQEADADMVADDKDDDMPSSDKKYEFIEFPTVTVNLDVVQVNRYVQASLNLAVADGKKGDVEKIVTDRTPELTSQLTVYLAGLTLEEVRGYENLNKIRLRIREMFNDALWGEGKPQIEHVLFKEFKVQ